MYYVFLLNPCDFYDVLKLKTSYVSCDCEASWKTFRTPLSPFEPVLWKINVAVKGQWCAVSPCIHVDTIVFLCIHASQDKCVSLLRQGDIKLNM